MRRSSHSAAVHNSANPARPPDRAATHRWRSGWQRSQSVWTDFSKGLTTFDAGRYLDGLRVCVRWLPIERRRTSLIGQLLMHLPAVLTHSAISPVDAEPTYDFIPKDKIIRHIRSPTFALGVPANSLHRGAGGSDLRRAVCRAQNLEAEWVPSRGIRWMAASPVDLRPTRSNPAKTP
jgi:hypothetical protein